MSEAQASKCGGPAADADPGALSASPARSPSSGCSAALAALTGHRDATAGGALTRL